MKTLTKILIGLVILVLVVGIIGLFFPSHVNVQRTLVMKASPAAVFSQVNDLKNWDKWMPWNKIDPKWTREWGAVTAGEGATYSWDSKNDSVRKGTITLSKSVPNEYVEMILTMEGMKPATGGFKLENAEGATRVTWNMDMDMSSNPYRKIIGPLMDKMVGGMFEKGLKNLDAAASEAPPAVADSTGRQAADASAAK